MAFVKSFAPLADPDSRILILGSMPGTASLKAGQYYAHPRNQFWPILSAIWGLEGDANLANKPYAERLPAALAHGLAIWDVYAGCKRQGSLDSAIADARLNALSLLRQRCPQLQALGHNGGESWRHRGVSGALGLPVFRLPSTSPANAGQTYAAKRDAWRAALAPYLALN